MSPERAGGVGWVRDQHHCALRVARRIDDIVIDSGRHQVADLPRLQTTATAFVRSRLGLRVQGYPCLTMPTPVDTPATRPPAPVPVRQTLGIIGLVLAAVAAVYLVIGWVVARIAELLLGTNRTTGTVYSDTERRTKL